MPNSPSAIKRMRSDAKKQHRNQTALTELKTLDKKLNALSDNPGEAQKVAQQAVSCYDRAVSKGIIPKNRAARRKSRIAKFLKKISVKSK
ncbi:MAG: 30S ribosomal protein S20 [Candidatus Omnitrophica bacterium]|nr:30S ribosomal protein S20 [Candidatus Omnitrophota bacterium]